MSTPVFNTKSPTIRRILKEASELQSRPDPAVHAAPLESNLFEWHFTLRGPPSTPFQNGAYHGRIILPPTYPLRPPSFRFLTPSGRFEVNREICLSISGHHEETWQPAWGIRTALWALRAFMDSDAKGQVGGMDMPKAHRLKLAEDSKRWRCLGCGNRANEDILREQEGTSTQDLEGDTKHVDGDAAAQVIPQELRFGFRDQMATENNGNGDKGKGKGAYLEEENVPPPKAVPDHDAAHPLRALATNATTTGTPNTLPMAKAAASNASDSHVRGRSVYTMAARTSTRGSSTNGVPPWVDKAITGIIAALAVMIIKKILV